MADIESRVCLYREVIKTCITSDGVLSRLPDIISRAEATRLRQLYERDRQKATGQMLDDILRSDEPGKWKMFLSALEDDEYDYIASLLSSDGRPKEISCYERRIIQLFWPKLVDIIDPSELVSHLYQKRVINMEDMQYINTRYNTSGQRAGASILLDRMQCRKKPEEWYKAFLEALNETGYSQMVAELEPDFNKCPHSSGAEPMDDGVSSLSSQTSGNVLQNTVSDYGKAYEAANNFSAPTNMPESVCLIDSQTCEDRDIESDSPRNAQHVPELPDTPRIKTRKRTKDVFFIESGENCSASEAKSRKAPTQTEDPINEREYHLSSDDGEQLEKKIASVQENGNTVDGDCRLDDTNTDPYAAQNEGLQATFLNLRKYQEELAENALKGDNTIICAETGSGKTMVAMHIVDQHLKRKENGKVVFMARQSTLVKQQYDRFKLQLPSHECVLLTGEDENSNKLLHLLEDYGIFFMTPQILLNNLENSQQKLRLYDFSLFILDECHHAKKEEAYNKLMRLYVEKKLNLSTSASRQILPQIVGLTASIGVGNACNDNDAMDYMLSICANIDAKNISTVYRNLEELKTYISIPTEEVISLKPRADDVCKKILIEGMNDIEDKLGDLVTLSKFYKTWNSRPRGKESQEYNNWTVKLMKEAKESQEVPEMSRDIQAGAKYLGILNSALEVNSLLMMNDVNQFLFDRVQDDLERLDKLNDFEKKLLDILKDHVKKMSRIGRDKENPNVRYLSNVLSKMLEEKGDDSRAMVFVKARQTCKRLAEFLGKDLERIDAAAAPLYGKEKRGDEEGMTESQQNEIVEGFRNGFYKVLVATSVGSEGIDVPDCNIVLSYNNIGNEIQKIQMSGRCRKEGGSTVILGDEAAVQKEKINAYKARMMYRAIGMVKALSQKQYDRKVKRFQNEEQRKAKLRRAIEERKQQMRTDENVYKLVCGRCSMFACLSTDIRTLKSNHHIVVNKEFANRITVKPIQEKKFDGMTKQSKIECHNCGIEWGIILVCNSCKCWTLLLKAFKVSKKDDEASGAATYTVYKQWRDVPFKLREIQDDEFKDLISIVQMK